MTPKEWEIVSGHFRELCDLPAQARNAKLRDIGLPPHLEKELVGLLENDGDPELSDYAASVTQLRSELGRSSIIGECVGPYRVQSELGEGAMGDVYTATRADGQYDATVAIKFLAKSSVRGRRLFERERQILAVLNHPAIARLIDAGESDRFGAYLVMEYVDGSPIHQYARKQDLGGRAIIQKIQEAALAVSAAHASLILHRDLKPDHILVDGQDRLRVLDFGVAQFLDAPDGQAMRTEGSSFTPRYAAPEQILGEPTSTATDVYALGLILYELLADGRSPFSTGADTDSDHNDIAARLTDKVDIRDSHLVRVAGLPRSDRKSLIAILTKALRRDPQERYSSAGQFASDLDAFLRGRSVSVRSAARVETLFRWARHHRMAALFAGMAVIGIVGGTAFSVWFAHEANVQRLAALDQAERAEKTADFLEFLFESASPGVEGPDVTARSLLATGLQRLETELADQPELVEHLEAVIGRSFLNLGLFDEALAIAADDAVPTTPERALLVSRALSRLGRHADAVSWLERALPSAAPMADRIDAAIIRSTALINTGDLDTAESAAMSALALADADVRFIDKQLTAQSMLAAVAFNRSDYEAALIAYEAILALHVERDGAQSTPTALAHHNLGGVAFMIGKLDLAMAHYREAITIYREAYGEDNRAVSMSLRSLGLSLRRSGRSDESLRVLSEAVTALEKWESATSPVYREALLQLAELRWLRGEPEAVRDLLAGLPEPGDLQAAYARQVECRLSVVHALSVSDLAIPSCVEEHEFPQSVQAFLMLARAQLAAREGQLDRNLVAEGEALTQSLVPSDPLLNAAFKKI